MEKLLNEINSLILEASYKYGLFVDKAEKRLEDLQISKNRVSKESSELYNKYIENIKSGNIEDADRFELEYNEKEDALQSIRNEISAIEDSLDILKDIKEIPKIVLQGFDKSLNDEEIKRNNENG